MTERNGMAALVTGAGRGIGLAVARHLAERGFDVALNDLADDDALDAAAQSVAASGARTVKVPGDVADVSSHDSLLDRAEAAIGPLSTLVNNAGVSVRARGDLLEVSEESYDRCMAVNAKAQFFLSQAFARRLVHRGRDDARFLSLINVTSANATAVAVNRGEYCASKAAAAMIAQVFSARLGGESIAVYDVQPGVIETDMTRPVLDDYRRRIDTEGLTLMPRLGQPEDVGRIVGTLARGDLPYTTGQVISADGGLLVRRF